MLGGLRVPSWGTQRMEMKKDITVHPQRKGGNTDHVNTRFSRPGKYQVTQVIKKWYDLEKIPHPFGSLPHLLYPLTQGHNIASIVSW
jgi:hypothetical protein